MLSDEVAEGESLSAAAAAAAEDAAEAGVAASSKLKRVFGAGVLFINDADKDMMGGHGWVANQGWFANRWNENEEIPVFVGNLKRP